MRPLLWPSLLGVFAWSLIFGPACPVAAEEYPKLPPEVSMFAGYRLVDVSDWPLSSFGSDSPSASYAGSTNGLRAGTRRASEYESERSSMIIGGRVEAWPLPQRFFLDADVEGEDHWFGELRHSYTDVYQLRVLSRRFVHNLDNLALYDLSPAANATEVSRLDPGTEYRVGIDIDQFRLRLKTPNFPLHLYTEGEVFRRDGEKQQLFMGGFVANAPVRVSKAMPVDQETTTVTMGANSHLRWLEIDLSHSWQQFDSEVADRYHYLASSVRPAGDYVHNALPALKTAKNTLKVHTTQTGKVIASATVSGITRTNETSDVYEIEAKRQLGHTDLLWTPLANLALGTKYRRQQSSGSGPGAIASPWNGAALPIKAGAEGEAETYAAFVRYSPFRRVTLKGQYSIEHRERNLASAIDWHLAEAKDINTLDAGLSWRPRHEARVRLNYRVSDADVDPGLVPEVFNNDPERTHQLTADLSYSPQAATTILIAALLKDESADTLSSLYHDFSIVNPDLAFAPVSAAGVEASDYDAFWQRYLASITHACTEQLSVTGSYVYSSMDTDRGFSAMEGVAIVDTGYRNSQGYHSFSLSASWQATERLSLTPTVDYTIATGDYSLTDSTLNQWLPLGEMAMVDTKELGLRLDGSYDLGQGWKAGVVVRYVELIDKSFDNPAQGDAYGALCKMTKVFK